MNQIGKKQTAALASIYRLDDRWRSALQPFHQAKGPVSFDTFEGGINAFEDFLRTDGRTSGLYLAMISGVATKEVIEAAYRQAVLNQGLDWVSEVSAISDPNIYLSAWYAFMEDFFKRAGELIPQLELRLAREKEPDPVEEDPLIRHPKEFIRLLQMLRSALDMPNSTFRSSKVLRDSWEYQMVSGQIAKLNNANQLVTIPLDIEEGCLRYLDILYAINALYCLVDPIDHIRTVYEYGHTSEWLKTSVQGSVPERLTFQSGAVLRRVIDEIVHKAGAAVALHAQAPHEIAFQFEGNRMNVSDISERGAFAAFADGRPEREMLVSLAGQLSPGGQVQFANNGALMISAIHITMPLAGMSMRAIF
ncbi:MAG: hypothetical protein ABH871_03770 [Pseudomonadota bacterium]